MEAIQPPPPILRTDKEYFRISKGTKFLCKTRWYAYNEKSSFHCTMQINKDVNRTLYKKDEKIYAFSHPEFGVDEIEDTEMSIDILVDEKNCFTMKNKKQVLDYFRELEKPSVWNKLF